MEIGALEKAIFHVSAKDIAKNLKENNDVTIITTLVTAGKIIVNMDKFEGEFQNFCEDVEEFTPVIITKINFKGKEYLYLEELMFEDGVVKEVEYDITTVYVDYNIKFVAPEKVYEDTIAKGGISVSFN